MINSYHETMNFRSEILEAGKKSSPTFDWINNSSSYQSTFELFLKFSIRFHPNSE